MNPLRETSEYLAARAVVGAVGALPAGAALRLGGWLGAAARLGADRREIVRRQIAAAFPGRDAAWVERTARGAYRHFGREMVEMARLQEAGTGELSGRCDADDTLEEWIDRMASGVGTLIVTGHLGNWEIAGAYLASRGVPLAAIVKRQSNRKFDAWLAASRRRVGMELVYSDEARRAVPRLLGRGRSIAIVADQDAHDRGLLVTFLGRPASTFRGPARLALSTGAPLLFGAAVREGRGYRISTDLVRPAGAQAPAPGTGAYERAERRITEAWVERLERQVRARPEQYFWFHRRWKSGVRRARNEHGGHGVPHASDADGRGTARGAESNPTNEENPS
ncbi:MAG: hypothetical protein PVF05_07835 [Gemmatimonadales bacterium]